MRSLIVIYNTVLIFTQFLLVILFHRNNIETLKAFGTKFRFFFENIGGVYIKFGQILSLRKDFIPIEICDELRKLLDEVPPFSTQEAKNIIAEELNRSVDEVFVDFPNKTFASASLGQVYKSKLKSGEEVVVKVLRPNIKGVIEEDLKLLTIAIKLVSILPFTRINLVPMVYEFKKWLQEEMDYGNEAHNMEEFAQYETDVLPIFNIPIKINLPKVYPEFSTAKVITMEFIDGMTVNQIINALRNKDSVGYKHIQEKGWNIRDINHRINIMQIKTVFVDGYFNADPHPSNIIITDDKKVYYIDFGLVAKLSDKMRVAMFRFFRAMAMADEKPAYDAVKVLLDLDRIKNEKKFRKEFHLMFLEMKKRRRETKGLYAKESTSSMLRFLRVIYKLKIQVPPEVGKAFRFILTSDSIQHALVPDSTIEESTKDIYMASLAATYIELKKAMTKKNLTKILVKFINVFEKEIFLDN